MKTLVAVVASCAITASVMGHLWWFVVAAWIAVGLGTLNLTEWGREGLARIKEANHAREGIAIEDVLAQIAACVCGLALLVLAGRRDEV